MITVRHKFNAKPQTIDDIRFSSKKEAKYYLDLKRRQAEGELLFFLQQVPIRLPGKIKYVVDFLIFKSNGEVEFVDVKGLKTQLYVLKKKQVEALYPFEIKEV